VINKTSIARTADLALSGFTAAGSSHFTNTALLTRSVYGSAGPDISPSGFSLQYPPNSISLLCCQTPPWGQIYLPAVMR
jgi:hypothetical protein